jgi:hypothetical protein
MKIEAGSPEQYIENLPEGRKEVMTRLRQIIIDNLPEGFGEIISYGMIGYVVPHSIYPTGYHADPKLPLPLLNIASQKNHIAVYHMGIYYDRQLLKWFCSEYLVRTGKNPDIGKSCIRFKKTDEIPFDLIAELVGKISPERWVELYESEIKKPGR